jgi:hypothetical protein
MKDINFGNPFINRFCELVEEINSINKKLRKENEDFYSQGKTFEEQYKNDINELITTQELLKKTLKLIELGV